MNYKSQLIGIALSLTVAGGALGCGGNSEIPDQGLQEQKTYRSTNSEEDKSKIGPPAQQEQVTGKSVRAVGPVATVNGTEIPAEAFNEEIQRLLASGQFPAELLVHVQDQIVEKLVDQHLIESAIAKHDIEVTDEEIDAKLAEVRAEFEEASKGVEGEKQTLDDLVRELGITQQELRDSIEQSIAIERMLFERGLEVPTGEKVRAFYDENPEMFTQPEQIHARHILVRVEEGADDEAWKVAEARAHELHALVTAEGADFEALAREHSQGPSAAQGGDLGVFPRGRMMPSFEEAAFALEPGEVSEPVRTEFGWHIIEVLERREAGVVEFDEIEDQLARELRNQAIQQALEGFLSNLRSEATIEIHSENIK